MPPFEFHWLLFGRILLAAALGTIVGYEREHQRKPAGMRTHGMVALGAALFTVISIEGFSPGGDPSRIASEVVTGVGFLGAGAILRQRGNVLGLTTAATLWVTAAIGMGVGAGMVLLSIETAALVFLILRFGPSVSPEKKHGAYKL
jgi:putative Mg2+ transporter-C (MgtC) family protein